MKRKKLIGEETLFLTEGEEREYDKAFEGSLLYDLSKLLNQSLSDVIEDCYTVEVKKFMGRIGQLNVRFDLPQNKLEKILSNADTMEMADVMVPPLYLANCKKIASRLDIYKNYSVIIDFPFGESVFGTKKSAVKDCVKQGAKSITVTLPTALMLPERIKEFKKQTKKIGVMADIPIGVALNAGDMTEAQIKSSIKIADKTRVDFMTFIFGDCPDDDMIAKMKTVKKYSEKKTVNVLGNIDSADVVSKLLALSVNTIYTPFADDIAKQVKERFNLTKLKLL